MTKRRSVVLLTDFGTGDPYVGMIKGALLSKEPQLRIVDLSHEVSAHDIRQAAYFLDISCDYFPRGTVFLTVVDPGVGSARALIAVKTPGYYFVAPDNGVLSPVLQRQGRYQARRIPVPEAGNISSTFHGRDIMAPVAASLALNPACFSRTGVPLKTIETFAFPGPRKTGDRILGEVVHIDRFGNMITNLGHGDFGVRDLGHFKVMVRGRNARGVRTYAECESYLCSLWNSAGRLEIACREDSAARRLKGRRGDKVCLWPVRKSSR